MCACTDPWEPWAGNRPGPPGPRCNRVGLPMPATLKRANNPKWDATFNKSLQELAWKTAIDYPFSGVKAASRE